MKCEQRNKNYVCGQEAEYISGWPNHVWNREKGNWLHVMLTCQDCLARCNLGREWTWIEHSAAEHLLRRRKELISQEVRKKLAGL